MSAVQFLTLVKVPNLANKKDSRYGESYGAERRMAPASRGSGRFAPLRTAMLMEVGGSIPYSS